MSFKWGNTKLKIIKDSYIPPFREVGLNEIALLPSKESSFDTSLQQGIKGRNRVGFEMFVYSYSEYQAFVDDYITKVSKVFIGADGYSSNMIIESLSQTTRELHPLRFTFSVGLIEVEA